SRPALTSPAFRQPGLSPCSACPCLLTLLTPPLSRARRGPRGGCFLAGEGVYVHPPSGGQDMLLSKRGSLSAFGALALILGSAPSPDAAPPARDNRRGLPTLDARSGP